MPANQLIVIRHAQKPTTDPKHRGVREDGTNDSESLTVHGWQHAGVLGAVFGGGEGVHPPDFRLGRPGTIFAAGPGKKRVRIDGKMVTVGSHSRRPLETVTPLAVRLNIAPVTEHTKGEEAGLVADAVSRDGTVFICWQHEDIPTIGNLIVGNRTTVPQSWPAERYDCVWVFDRHDGSWAFRQLFHDLLMPG